MASYDRHASLVNYKKCCKCGKSFMLRCSVEVYAWQLASYKGPRYYCSYTCMRIDEVPRLAKAQKKYKKEIQGHEEIKA